MSKFHINKHGVPAPCRAKEGNCPLGGDSGNENHFDTQQEAQEHADKINSAEHGHLPGMNNMQDFKYSSEDLEGMKGKQANVEYDGKSFEGEVIGAHFDGEGSDKNGVIIQDSEGNVKHIKAHRMTSLELSGEGSSSDLGASEGVTGEGQRLASLISKRRNSVPEPDLPHGKNSVRSIDDLETLVHTRDEYITSQEHDPVKNVQSMFDHVAGKSGKLYRYEEEGNYLETHNYDFNGTMNRHEQFLESDGYMDEDGYDENEAKPKEMYQKDLEDHRKLHEYSSNLAIEYGKDFEKKVATSGKYNLDEQDQIQGEYRQALADKVGQFVQNYGEED